MIVSIKHFIKVRRKCKTAVYSFKMASSSKVPVILGTSNALIYLSYRINSQPGSAVIHVFPPFWLLFYACIV